MTGLSLGPLPPPPPGPQGPRPSGDGLAIPAPRQRPDSPVMAPLAPPAAQEPIDPDQLDSLTRLQLAHQGAEDALGLWEQSWQEMPDGDDKFATALRIGKQRDEHMLAGLQIEKLFDAEQQKSGVAAFISSAVKTFADGRVALADLLIPDSMLESAFGTPDPNSVDVVAGIGSALGLVDKRLARNIGRDADAMLERRLGNAKYVADGIGIIASFGTGAGAWLGKIGERAGAATLGKMAENAMRAKVLARYPGAAERVQRGSNVWHELYQLPEWKRAATIAERTMAFAGRNAKDVIGVTTGNMLQAFAMSPDGERGRAMLMAGLTGPMIVPIARYGQHVAGKVAAAGVKGEQARRIFDAYFDHAAGKLDDAALDAVIRANSKATLRALGNVVVAPAFEGTAFWGMQPESIADLMAWAQGDQEAGARAFGTWMGSVLGVAGIKMMNPQLAPLFKQVRPDLNTMRTRGEAWSNQEAARELSQLQDLALADTALQEPQARGEQDPQAREASRETVRREGEQRAAYEELAVEQKAEEMVQQGQESLRQKAMEEHQRRIERYEWAEEPAAPLLRSHWEPSRVEGSDDLIFRYGSDQREMRLNKDGSLAIDDGLLAILRETGRIHESSETDAPGRFVFRGEQAQRVIHDMTMLTLLRQAVGGTVLARNGMIPVGDGTWHYPPNPDGTLPDQVYRPGLDGKFQTTEFPSQTMQDVVIEAVGGMELPNAVWSHDNATVITQALIAKMGVAPDPVADQLIAAALQTARFGQGSTADQIRMWLEMTPPQEIISRINGKDIDGLAFDMGSLVAGTHNAEMLRRETHTQTNTRDVQRQDVARATYDPEAKATVKLTRRQAQALERWAIKKGDLGKRLKELADDPESNGGEVEITGKDFKRLAELWAKYGPRSVAPNIRESIDQWMQSTSKALGGQPEQVAGAQPDALRPEPLGTLLERRGRVVDDVRRSEGNWVETPDGNWVRLTDPMPTEPDPAGMRQEVAEAPTGEPGPDQVTTPEGSVEAVQPLPPKDWGKAKPSERIEGAEQFALEVRNAGEKVKPEDLREQFKIGRDRANRIVKEVFADAELVDRQPIVRSEPVKTEPETAPGEEPSALVEKPPNPESGAVLIGDPVVLKEGLRIVKGVAEAPVEAVFTPEHEALQKQVPKSDVSKRALQHSATAEALTGKYGPKVRRLIALFKTPEGRAILPERTNQEGWVAAAENADKTRFRALVEGDAKPRNAVEQEIAAVGQDILRGTWDDARAAGTLRNINGELVPMEALDRHLMSQIRGRDFEEVAGNAKLRRALWEATVASNPEVFRGTGKDRRRITADDLEAEWREATDQRETARATTETRASAEFAREVLLPDRIKVGDTVYEVLETNPFRAMERIIRTHAQRTATVQEFGQHIRGKKKIQEALERADQLLAEGKMTPEQRAAIEANIARGGVESAVKQFRDAAKGREVNLDEEVLVKRYQNLVSRLQGVEPERLGWVANLTKGFVQKSSQAMTIKSGIYDPPETVTRLFYLFPRRMLKALWRGVTSPMESIQRAEDLGRMARIAGDAAVEQAPGTSQKILDVASKPSQFLERVKGAVANEAAEILLAGKLSRGEYETLRDIGSVPVDTLDRLQAGQATKLDRDVIGQAVVRMATSRTPKALASRFAQSPRVAMMVRFTPFATERMHNNLKAVSALWRAEGAMGKARAATRLGRLLVGQAAGGAAAQLIALTITESFRGDPAEGWRRFARMWSHAWEQGAAEMGKQVARSIAVGSLGGPVAAGVDVLTDITSGEKWARMTVPSAAIMGAYQFGEAMLGGDVPGLIRAAGQFGLPLSNDIANAYNFAAASQAVVDRRRDSRMVNAWRDKVGAARPDFATDPGKADFYRVMRRVADQIAAAEGAPENVWKAVEAEIQKAEGMATGQDIAGYLRNRQHLAQLSPEMHARFIREHSEEEVRRVEEHDLMLRDLARIATKRPGTNRTPWAKELEDVELIARSGKPEAWKGARDRALDIATVGKESPNEIDLGTLQEFADRIAAYPMHFDAVFSERDARVLHRKAGVAERARFVAVVLRKMAVDRLQAERREQIRDARQKQ